MTDDPTLLRRYVENASDEAFAELVQRHLPLVYSAALRRTNGDPHRAQDAAQIVFAALAREASRLTRHPSLVGWLYTATRHAASHLMRAEQRRVAREQQAHAMNETLASSEPAADWAQLRPVLDDALDELDPRDREAVLLRYFHQQQFAAVAVALRVSEEAARKRVDRALDRLGALLARRGITSTAAALGLALATEAAVAVPATTAATITASSLAAGSAAAGSTAAVTLFTLMTTSKIVTGTAAAVAAVAIGAALYQTRAAHESAAAIDSLHAERTALHGRLGALQQQLRETSERNTPARVAAAAPTGGPAAAAPSAALQHGSTIDYVLAHPETHTAYVEQQALRALARYDRFIKSEGLSTEQQDRLLHELREMAAADFDFMAALHSQGYGIGNLPSDPQALRTLRQPLTQKREAFVANMRAMLGDERAKQLLEFGRTAAERNVADQLASRLYYTDSALTSAQADQLVQILAAGRLNPQAAGSPASTMSGTAIAGTALNGALAQAMQHGGLSLLEWRAPISDAALAQAASVLSPAQLATLKQVQAEQIRQLQVAPPPPRGFLGGPR